MSILDALTILGSGVARGYRGSQELQRQLVEAKRKALLEERELAMREQAQIAQNALAAAQTGKLGVDTRAGEFGLGEARAESERGATPIMPGGIPSLSIGGNKFQLPNRLDTLLNPEIAGMLRQSSEEDFRAAHPSYYMNSGAYGQNKLDPRARRIDYLLKTAGVATGGGPGQFEEPDAYQARTAATFKYILDQLRLADPEAFGDTLQADTTKADRFKVKVNLQGN